MTVKISGDGPITGLGPAGQCRLVLNGASLALQPYMGNLLCVAGANTPIPAAGVNLAATGLAVSTLLYIYAAFNGTWTLVPSVTVPVADPNNGSMVMTGDVTKALVGMAYLKAGPVFSDTAASRLVASWFNPRRRTLANFFASTTPSETNRSNTDYAAFTPPVRVEFLTWGDAVDFGAGFSFINTGANTAAGGLAFDGIVLGEQASGFAVANNITGTSSAKATPELTRGYHTCQLVQRQTGGTSTWWGGTGFQTERCALSGAVTI